MIMIILQILNPVISQVCRLRKVMGPESTTDAYPWLGMQERTDQGVAAYFH